MQVKKETLVAAVFLLCLAGGCKKDSPTAYELGKEDLEKGNYTEAIENFQDAVQKGEKGAESWRGIGVCWSSQGVYDKAQEAFETALSLLSDGDKAMDRDLHLYLADAQYHQEDYQGCIETCDQLLKGSKVKDGYFLRGSAYLHLDQYKQADMDFGKVVSGSEDYQDYLDVYWIYRECDLNADGVGYLEDALDITPKTGEDHYDLGRVYFYLAEYTKAEKELKKALDKEWEDAGPYLGKVYLASGDKESAAEQFRSCLEIQGQEAAGYNGLAYCSILEEDYDSALTYIEKGLQEKDEEETQALLFNQIVLYERQGDFATAKEKMAAYLEAYPGDQEAIREDYFLETR